MCDSKKTMCKSKSSITRKKITDIIDEHYQFIISKNYNNVYDEEAMEHTITQICNMIEHCCSEDQNDTIQSQLSAFIYNTVSNGIGAQKLTNVSTTNSDTNIMVGLKISREMYTFLTKTQDYHKYFELKLKGISTRKLCAQIVIQDEAEG